MKNLFFLSLLFIVLQSSAQVTVFLQPHFAQGKEGTLYGIDTTSSYWPGNVHQYCFDSTYVTYPDFCYNASISNFDTTWLRHIICFNQLSDTTIIPHGAIISSAVLHLYGVPSSGYGNWGNTYFTGSPYEAYGPNPGWLYELSDTFNENTVTWLTAPGIKHTDSVAMAPSSARWNEDDSFVVTTMVADMIAHNNTGFLAKLQNEVYGNERVFGSCYYSGSTKHPSLKITYNIASGVRSINDPVKSISIYPNPVHNAFTISATDAITSIIITNLLGQTVYTNECNAPRLQIDVADLPNGTYFVKVNSGEVSRFVKE